MDCHSAAAEERFCWRRRERPSWQLLAQARARAVPTTAVTRAAPRTAVTGVVPTTGAMTDAMTGVVVSLEGRSRAEDRN